MDPRIKLFAMGYTDLVCVAPPGVPISQNSGLRADDLGKRPGKKGVKGWYGYSWLTDTPTEADVQKWVEWDANVGLRGTRFPALDIDSTDDMLTRVVKKIALEELGPAPSRVGKAPKELLVYRTDEPFSRVALEVDRNDQTHLIEFLGHGRQYLVYGTHPSGARYSWSGSEKLWDVSQDNLSAITGEDVERFLTKLEEKLASVGLEVRRVGRASAVQKAAVPQEHLLAPSLDALRDVVEATPNDLNDRDDYVMYGHAIKAAAGPDNEEEGYFIFAGWCDRWEQGQNDPDTVRSDWRRMHAPFRIGYDWLVQQAPDSFNAAVHEFEADPKAVLPPVEIRDKGELLPVELTDDYLTEEIRPRLVGRLRFDYPNGRWHIWDGSKWAHDDMGAAAHEVTVALRHLARVLRSRISNLSGKEKQRYNNTINKLGNVSTIRAVLTLLEGRLAVGTDAFDSNGWELNTPDGVYQLDKQGVPRFEAVPEGMHSKSTSVAPAPPGTRAPLWERFIEEVTNGDKALAWFMQKQAGYALSGVRREQTLSFVWGPGGNGKSVFVDAIMGVMGDYATTAPMETFAASKGDKHPTDLAGLMGARLVTASETQAGRMWDEQRLKAVTGGDRMRARFMRQDFVEFVPRFKLILIGNHEPQIGNVDDAMRRRIHIVPFTFKPANPDLNLPEKLKAEYPAILRWMLEGAEGWRDEGLEPPECVLLRTEEYFEDEDLTGLWIEECCELDPDGEMASADAYASWQRYCAKHGEPAGTQRGFSKLLRTHAARGAFSKGQVGPSERRVRGWRGITLIDNPNNIQGDLT